MMNRPLLPSFRYMKAVFFVYLGIAVVGLAFAFVLAAIVGAVRRGDDLHALIDLCLSAIVAVETSMLAVGRSGTGKRVRDMIFGAIRDEHRASRSAT